MLKVVILALILLGIFKVETSETGVQLHVVEPVLDPFTKLVYTSNVPFRVLIAVPYDVVLPKLSFICSIEVDVDEAEQCIDSHQFSISLLRPGSHEFTLSLKTYADIAGYRAGHFHILASTRVLVDTADPLCIEEQERNSLSVSVLSNDVILSRYDYLFAYNGSSHYKPIAVPHMHQQRALLQTKRENIKETIEVALFMKSGGDTSPSDRFIDWLCDHEAFSSSNFHLVVLTGTDGKSVGSSAYFLAFYKYIFIYFSSFKTDTQMTDVCGAPIIRFEALSQNYAKSLTVDADTLRMPEIQAVAAYLHSVDVLLTVNTYGDAQTSLLLFIIHAQRENNNISNTSYATNNTHEATLDPESGSQPVSKIRQYKVWKTPLIVMDLPNLGLPIQWNGRVDAFIAPSRFVAFNTITTDEGM